MSNNSEWNLSHAYGMVRERYHVLTDRQRLLQSEQITLSDKLKELRTQINKLGDAIAVVEKAGGDATNLRTQINAAHAEKHRIEPRYIYLEDATAIIAANLRLLDQAHNSLHWLRFENEKLAIFDKNPEVLVG